MDVDQDLENAETKDSIMIALLPTTSDWCTIDLPHLTLVYAGIISSHKPTDFNEMAKDAAMLAMLTPPISLPVMGKERFGPNGDTDVYELMPTPEILAMRRAVEDWNASEYDFDPHVTIGPAGTQTNAPAPSWLVFNRVVLAWGTEQLTFNMSTGGY